ncbi:MAG: sigma-70 family RNA polymerase sigma factor [Oscillospiraceae bacterium]|nr:sigma-70 family RNA polymerase sigma factor [Oscillospiraceae bacterium]
MIDVLLLRGIRIGHESALAQTIDKYTNYVCTIIRNTAGAALRHEDIEEVASDVFLALWNNADKADKLKQYIAAIARNKAKNKLREAAESLPLNENMLADDGVTMEDRLISDSERQLLKSTVLAMEETDRDIFLRYYYGGQTVSEIALRIGMREATIKQRLVRGRNKLRQIINMEVVGL